jgi:nitroreductase/NAD-dependent dihydropyrimidine dehydrogenase PreA subunit
MLNFRIDEDRCIQCGECAADCPAMCISLDNGLPEINEKRCIRCQHCLAVCPTAALSILDKDPDDSRPLHKDSLPAPEKMETLLMGRRSVRRYKPDPVPKETIRHLLQITGHAPTGMNVRQTLYTVVDDPEVMNEIRAATLRRVKEVMEDPGLPKGLEIVGKYVAAGDKMGVDIFYRGAPHLLIVSSPHNGPSPDADCLIALSQFDLLAATMGLGTVWDGLAKWAISRIAPDLRERLGIPEDHSIGYAMAFGYPAVTYYRTVQHDAPAINVVGS